MATIQLRNVTKAYSRRAASQGWDESAPPTDDDPPIMALDHVNLTIPNGHTMAILGPSGCGKSTLLRVVAGLELGYSGDVLYDGQDMRDLPPKDRHIGMVFQDYALYPHLKGWDNLAFFFKVHDIPDEETRERIHFTSQLMGIGFDDLLKRVPKTYSGGEKQRVALARAIVRNPRLLLFDEPLSNIDAKLRHQTRVEIKRLLRRFQITTLYVTHDQEEAFTLGDHLAIMREGRIEQVDAYAALRRNPINTFVAEFLGHPPMNLLTGGRVEADRLCLDNFSAPLPQTAQTWASPGRSVTIGIHAEAIALASESLPPPDGFQLRGVIEVIEPNFGHHTQLLHLRTGRFAYTAAAPLEIPLKVGEEVTVILPTAEFYFFNGKTGRRMG